MDKNCHQMSPCKEVLIVFKQLCFSQAIHRRPAPKSILLALLARARGCTTVLSYSHFSPSETRGVRAWNLSIPTNYPQSTSPRAARTPCKPPASRCWRSGLEFVDSYKLPAVNVAESPSHSLPIACLSNPWNSRRGGSQIIHSATAERLNAKLWVDAVRSVKFLGQDLGEAVLVFFGRHETIVDG